MDTSVILALFARLGTRLQCQFTRQSCSMWASLLLRRCLDRDIRKVAVAIERENHLPILPLEIWNRLML